MEHGIEQRLLGGKMPEDERLRDAASGGEFAGRDAVQPVAREERKRGAGDGVLAVRRAQAAPRLG